MNPRESNLLRSLTETTPKFYAWTGFLSLVVLWGMAAWIHQLHQGLVVTGLRDQIFWGLYITNFVFFIGISHAGTFISAILRITNTGWRRPVTRMAEAITVFALCIGAPMVIVDLGRPERMLNLLRYGRIQSPILWDVLGLSAYLMGCILYFYIPMIPDLGMLALEPAVGPRRRRLYRILSLGWNGSVEQKRLLEKSITVMAIIIIPLAVSLHTVVSWIFAMTLRPGWNSSIFGPYFVVAAIFSGIACVILSMYVLRRVLRLEEYLEPLHFRNLGALLLAFAMLYLYFNINEYLTVGYKLEGVERTLIERLFFGDYALDFWTAQTVGVFLPMVLLMAVLGLERYKRFTIPTVALASSLVVAGAWLKRYIIIVPTLSSPYLPMQHLPESWEHYQPTWVEWSITASAFAAFLLIYTLLAKIFPMVSIWETREGEVAQPKPEPAPSVPPSSWRPIPSISILLVVGLLVGAGYVGAKEKPPAKATPTALSLQWHTVAPSKALPPSESLAGTDSHDPDRVFFLADPFLERLLGGRGSQQPERVIPTIAITATLRDPNGQPISFEPVAFCLKTSFGVIDYGKRPTDATGTAQLILREQRYGIYPVTVSFMGDEGLTPSRAESPVEFGPRPVPALPPVGVLITPYATPEIGLPFIGFYGLMWLFYGYCFGYLIVWRLRRSGTPAAEFRSVSPSDLVPNGDQPQRERGDSATPN